MAKTVPVSAQGVAEHMGVATVVLNTGDGEAVSEAVELLWVNRIHQKAAFEQRLDNWAVWHLDGYGDDCGLGMCHHQQPGAHLSQPAPPCTKAHSPTTLPSASTRQT
jgi:hypothetical protein